MYVYRCVHTRQRYCNLLLESGSSTRLHVVTLSLLGVSLPVAGTRTHPMSGACNRGRPLLCATLRIRVPGDIQQKLRSAEKQG